MAVPSSETLRYQWHCGLGAWVGYPGRVGTIGLTLDEAGEPYLGGADGHSGGT